MHMSSLLDRPPKLAGKHFVLVEDKPLVSLQAEDELRDAGATVLGPAVCVDQALRLIGMAVADGGIGAAVLDINLDGRHVRPVADRLAALGVPFLFATGDGDGCDTSGPAFRGRGAAPPR